MRAELPWNVAGIPPEAREAARAAARREGLSVGEWLTRRILRSFSGMEEEIPAMPYENRAPTGAPLDSWGMPPSAASRRDTEEMMARVNRSESESNDAWRRIEDQLRGLGRRIDSSERTHSESNRVISRTAQEMNVTAREQAQAFDQIGLNVMALNERLERLERSNTDTSIKDAVKALHQGLSRLADQITATANNSADQVTQLTGNLEQLAGRVGQGRVDAEDNHKLLVVRTEAAEQRLAGAEKTAQFNTNALDHALEKIEASANQRATDQVENQRRFGQTEEALNRLEDSIARLEMRLPDAAFERRLDAIEHSVTGIAARLENYDPKAQFDASMQALSYRLEALEKDHTDLAAETRSKLRPQEPPAFESPSQAVPNAFAAPNAFEPPPFAESLPPYPDAFTPPPHALGSQTLDAYGAEGTDAFAPPHAPSGFTFDIPPEPGAPDPFAPAQEMGPELAGNFEAPEADNFLTQARRSARAATEQAETERKGRFAGLRWNRTAPAEDEEKSRPRYLIPAALGLVTVLALAVGLMMTQRGAPTGDQTTTRADTGTGPTYSVPNPPNSDDTQFVVAPQAGEQQVGDAEDFTSARSEPQGSSDPAPLQQRDVRNAPVKPVPDAPAGARGVERVIQLANGGNPIALTILGLRALDGTNGSPINLPDAVRFLTQASEKGQAVAQYRLGTMYERGQGVPADGTRAAQWYERSANQGNRKAMHNLAVSHASGAPGKKNMAEAARWFAKAAALGLSDSQFNLAVLYERGDGVPQSLVDAYKWYSIAAASGDAESKSRIAVLQTQLSDSDRANANKSAGTFHAAALNRSANVPPEPADLG